MAVNWPDSGSKRADKAGVSRAPSDKPGIARYRLDHCVHLTAQHLLREAEREALHGVEGDMRRPREREGIDDRVDDDRPAAMGERLRETRPDVARLLDADALRAHRLRHFGEVRVLEVHAEGHEAGLLHLDLDEVERLIGKDDLDHRYLSLHLGQQV